VRVKEIPLTMPILPFACACSSSGISNDTVVAKAIVRKLPVTDHSIIVIIKARNQGDHPSVNTPIGARKKIQQESRYNASDAPLDQNITVCFLL
jgi:hypothetical protein